MRSAEELLKDLGQGLAPYVAPHVADLLRAPVLTGDYDSATCALYVEGLGDPVLVRGEKFFEVLASKGEIGSLALTELLGAKRPSNLAFFLTTPLKRRATKLGLPRPWTPRTRDGRTVWVDEKGIAQTMRDAIKVERTKRGI